MLRYLHEKFNKKYSSKDSFSERATSAVNASKQFDVALQICEKIDGRAENVRYCVQSIMKRMCHTDPNVGDKAIAVSQHYCTTFVVKYVNSGLFQLLDACVYLIGDVFRAEIMSEEFSRTARQLKNSMPFNVADKLRESLDKWTMRGASQPVSTTATNNPLAPALNQLEEDDFSRAIELSLNSQNNKTKLKPVR